MVKFVPLREVPSSVNYGSNDFLVLFGELFGKGYANGIVEYAKSKGMKIVGSTVGRRDADSSALRPLNPEELTQAKALAPFDHFINIPLEAGFDFEPGKNGKSPVELLQGIKMNDWAGAKIDWESVEISRASGEKRFRNYVQNYFEELKKIVPESSRVVLVHMMAGGIPRAKIYMPTLNRVFKGLGERHVGSQALWESDLGKLAKISFDEVSALTFKHLLDLSKDFRERSARANKSVAYLAYGYHGTEILVQKNYCWQSYSPYLQGWAKMKLEDIAIEYSKKGINCCVYNCPEILTQSSSLFQGVELPLYSFLRALDKDCGQREIADRVWNHCRQVLRPECSVEGVFRVIDEFYDSDITKKWTDFENWPLHSGAEQMKLMLEASDQIVAMHKSEKETMTLELSRYIFEGTGRVMLDGSASQSFKGLTGVYWLGHDVLARAI